MSIPRSFKKIILLAGGSAVIIGLAGYAINSYRELRTERIIWEERVAGLKNEVAGLEQFIASTTAGLARVQGEKGVLAESLQAEQNKNTAFAGQIQEISATVGILQKLSTTDQELLKKYSKVYFLSENYSPEQLSSVDNRYLFDQKRPQLIHAGVLPYLQSMLATALPKGITLKVVSGYRSFYDQVSVKSGYKFLYGGGTANQFSADQGYSEHQLGSTVDFTTPDFSGLSLQFEKSSGYKWLAENAYKFGFTLSYPRNNGYYQFEPWHWRFVGITLATRLHSDNEYFYHLDQREIDKYLLSIFN